jgi:hypothetical protein
LDAEVQTDGIVLAFAVEMISKRADHCRPSLAAITTAMLVFEF